jgi:hypothetical protein
MSKKGFNVHYSKIRAINNNMWNRDYLNKSAEFSDSGNFYCYQSSIPNDIESIPPPEGVERI